MIRSSCVFPASKSASTTSGYKSIRLVLQEKRGGVPEASPAYSLPTISKAAWTLTLQCFVFIDVLCFRYSGPVDFLEEGQQEPQLRQERRSTLSSLYVTKLNRDEPVRQFLARLDKRQEFTTFADPTEFEIEVVEEGSTSYQCNTALHCQFGDLERSAGDSTNLRDQQLDLKLTTFRNQNLETFADLEYNVSHINADIAESVLRTFQHIFEQILQASDQLLLRDIELCPPSDQAAIQKFTSVVSETKQTCIHDLIVEQCKLHPDRIAARSPTGNLTYGELDDLSSRLAQYLVLMGVRPESFILSCFNISTWAIIARLAILRAGGAYISVYAGDPPSFLDSVIHRTKAQIMITDSSFVSRYRGVVPVLVELSSAWLRGLPIPLSTQICEDVRPESACVVLFTSGSTGTPKGIIQTHSAYATAIQDYTRNLKLGSETRFLHFDEYAFDISNLEFFVPLIIGGCCCVPGPMGTAQDLVHQICVLEANTMFLTPTVAIKLQPDQVPSLTTLCVGGEPLPKDLMVKWSTSTTRLINQYGMGEAAVCCAYNDCIDPMEGAKIGRTSTGAIFVVDPWDPEKLMPIGAAGEILIEGSHLARGYLDQTAIKINGFLETMPKWMSEMHPTRRSAKFYRSGDLGQLGYDGMITYLGRKDNLLKFVGTRVDASEVEYVARKCLSTKDSFVVDLLGVVGGDQNQKLSAFLYLDAHPRSTAPLTRSSVPSLVDATTDQFAAEKLDEIKATIAQTLPWYMVPTFFILVTWMPRTASKKLDRKRIHALGQEFYSSEMETRIRECLDADMRHILPDALYEPSRN